MQLVILAAGHGRRFGGLKQLAAVGPNGEAIMDYTARSAERCGFESAVVIVREEIREEIEAHIASAWPASWRAQIVCQMPIAGTAPAVLSAAGELQGPFGVVNADDLYGEAALTALYRTLGGAAPDVHVMVAYHLGKTILTSAPVTRGLCELDGEGFLVRIVEQSVRARPDGGYEAAPLGPNRKSDPDATYEWRRSGDEPVSMNLWGFQQSVLDDLAAAVEAGREQAAAGAELLLPDVVGELVSQGRARLRAVVTESRCIGITHPDDLDLVRREIATELAAGGGPDAAVG
ncbi:MAG TPA: NTP transferase domain-containing protein [Acidimicrobiales bacterium]|nr:NTP transferase domain-containing protein [Acidimicrobiales bacterium]